MNATNNRAQKYTQKNNKKAKPNLRIKLKIKAEQCAKLNENIFNFKIYNVITPFVR